MKDSSEVTETSESADDQQVSAVESAPAEERPSADVEVTDGDDVADPEVDHTDVADADATADPDDASDAESDPDESDAGNGEGDRQSPAHGRNRRAQLEREGEVAADFLENLLDICDLDGDLDVDIDGDRASVSLVDSDEGRVPRRLVGTQGQVLDALQELTRPAMQSQTGERSRLMLDVAGHRAQRRATLVDVARVAISKVKDGSDREALDPMTAFERKVVHDEVLAAGLTSESEGVEPRRFVVILPA